jgi:tetratricopeptide (TPR) repeat protein
MASGPNRPQVTLITTFTAALFLSACATPEAERRWEYDRAAADRLADDERWEEALVQYDTLFRHAPSETDARYITYRIGLIEEHRGNNDRAIAVYTDLLVHHQLFDDDDEYTARGLYRLGQLLYYEMGDRDEGLRIWRHVVHYFPAIDGPAHRALDGILLHFERNELHEEAVVFFATEFEALEHTRMGDNMLYWLGFWLRHHLDEEERALEIFLRVREQYYDYSGLRDEAEWQIVEILHGRGEFQEEIALLDEIRLERDEGIFLGPYATTSMEEAAYRIGIVLLEDLNDPEGAIDAFQVFLDRWRLSLRRDDAAYGIVRATAIRSPPEQADQVARDFLRDYSDSRYTDEVETILAQPDGAGP